MARSSRDRPGRVIGVLNAAALRLGIRRPPTAPQAAPGEDFGARRVPRDNAAATLMKPARIAALLLEAEGGDIAAQQELFEHMEERDGVLGSHLATRKAGVARADFDIVPDEAAPKGGRDKAEKAADLCREIVGGIAGLRDARKGLLDAIGKGFAVREIEWDTTSVPGQWRVARLLYRPQRHFTLAGDGETLMIRGDTSGDEPLAMAEHKFIVHVVRSQDGYLWRAALMRRCVSAFIVRHYGWADWLAYAEVYGMPPRIAYLKESVPWDSTEAKQLWNAVKALGHDYAAIVREGNRMEMMQLRAGEGRIFERLLGKADTELTLAIMGQLLTSGGEGGGSRALGQVHNQVRHDLIEDDAEGFDETMRDQLLTPITRLNLGLDHPVPVWHTIVDRPEDLRAKAETYGILADHDVPIPLRQVRAEFNIDEPQDGEELMQAARRGPDAAPVANAAGCRHGACAGRAGGLPKVLLNDAGFVRTARAGGGSPEGLLVWLNQAPPEGLYAPPPADAMDWLAERRVPHVGVWDELSPAGKQRAWWATGLSQERTALMGRELMAAMRARDSENEFLARLEGLGLSVPGARDPAAGQMAAWQARLVHRNNRRAALNASTWMQMRREQDSRGYAEWLCGARTCPICESYCGTVAPLDAFAERAPQLHHACECMLVSVSAIEVRREGLIVADGLPDNDLVPDGWTYSRDDAYYLASAGGGPATDAGRRDAQLLAGMPTVEALL